MLYSGYMKTRPWFSNDKSHRIVCRFQNNWVLFMKGLTNQMTKKNDHLIQGWQILITNIILLTNLKKFMKVFSPVETRVKIHQI